MSGIIPIHHPNERIDIMSASRKKKERKLLEAEQASLNSVKTGKEKKTGLDRAFRDVLIIVGIIVLAAIVIISFVSCRNWNRKNATVAKIGDEKISASMMNYAFFDSVNNFYGQYGSLAGYIIDPNTPLDKQVCTMTSDGTMWSDFFIKQAGETLEHYYNICDAAERDGFKLSDEDKKAIDSVIESYEFQASKVGTNLDNYLSSVFGKGCNEDSFKDYVTLQMTVESYNRYFVEKYEPADEDALAAYNEDPTKYDTVTCYMVTKTASSFLKAAEDGSLPEVGDAEKAEAKAAAEEAAANFDTAELSTASYAKVGVSGSYGDEAANWLFDSARKADDTAFFANKDNTEYYVFKFVEKDDYNYSTVNCRSFVVAPAAQTTDPDAAKEEATRIYNEIKEKITAENFEEVAAEYGLTVDNSENLTKSGLDDAVVTWLFGKPSANDIKDFSADGSYTFYIFDSEGENCNTLRVKNTILSEKWEGITHTNEISYREKNFKYIRTDMLTGNYFS